MSDLDSRLRIIEEAARSREGGYRFNERGANDALWLVEQLRRARGQRSASVKRWLAALSVGVVSTLVIWLILYLLIIRLAGEGEFWRGFVEAWGVAFGLVMCTLTVRGEFD